MRKILLFTAIMCSAPMANAQEARERGILFGFKGGVNASNYLGDVENNEIRTSANFGFLTEFVLTDRISFQPEFVISGQGYSNENPDGFSRQKLSYFNVPLIIKYYPTKHISFEAGPQAGLQLTAKDRNNEGVEDVEDQKAYDLGVNLGLGYRFGNGIFFQSRYNYGLTNLNDGPDSDINKYNNSVLSFSIRSDVLIEQNVLNTYP